MGYYLYITRRKTIEDDSPDSDISAEEWRECVGNDPELSFDESSGDNVAVWSGPSEHETPWLEWSNGQIETKNPDRALIVKMASIAASLNAHVEGEEGEIYDRAGNAEPAAAEPGSAASPPSGGIIDVIRSLWSRISTPTESVEASDVPFKVGDRVRDIFGDLNTATVTKIDLAAEHGMGRITVRYDDGRIGHHSALAHGLEPIPKE